MTTPISQNPGLAVQKRVISTGPYDSVGDLIVYTITAANTGNTTLTGVTITEVGIGAVLVACTAPIPATLAPGAVVDCTATHTVTQANRTQVITRTSRRALRSDGSGQRRGDRADDRAADADTADADAAGSAE